MQLPVNKQNEVVVGGSPAWDVSHLDAEQREAVTTTEGFVRVIAGAGSGKTRTLTHRYLYLLNELGISPSHILCVTFTNKAATEMKNRIRKMAKGDDSGYISTFHGFCVRFLREEIHVLNYPKEFMILDEEDQKSILKKAYGELRMQLSDMKISSALDFIGGRKANEMDHVPFFAEHDAESLLKMVEGAPDKWMRVYYRYLYEQKKIFALDFDDLILVTIYILQHFPEKLKKWQERMMYVMVDEFQDIDGQQYMLADLLSGYHKNLFVVGDPDQTIYTWRGADVNRILEFDKFHENTSTILLQNNYRSTPSILKIPNRVIKNNQYRIDKQLKPMRSGGRTPLFCHAKNTREEAGWIVSQIEGLTAIGVKRRDIAVLYRMHSQSRSIEEALMSANVPYKVYSGVGFYQRQEVKDVICYLRMLVYGDDLSFVRTVNTPKRMFGNKKLVALQDLAASLGLNLYETLVEVVNMARSGDAVADQTLRETGFDCRGFIAKSRVAEYVDLIEKFRRDYPSMRPSETLTKMLQESRYEEMLRLDGDDNRLDNLAEFKQGLMEFEKYFEEDATLDEYLQNVVLFTNADEDPGDKDQVQLMTIHNAKGLEFPYVFVCGMNEGFFPAKKVQTKIQLEEERRLAYVAFTRAEDGLFLSDAEGGGAGEEAVRYPSRFLLEMDLADLHIVNGFNEEWYRAAREHIAEAERNRDLLGDGQLDSAMIPKAAFGVGARVHHRILGFGTVEKVDEENFGYTLRFDNVATPRTIHFEYPLKAVVEGDATPLANPDTHE